MMNQMSLAVSLASPLVQLNFVGFAGIVVWHLIPRRRATTRLVVQIPFFIVMTAILVGNDIAPHRFDGVAAMDASALLALSAKLLWWVHLAWAIIGFVRLLSRSRGPTPRGASSAGRLRRRRLSRHGLSILAFVFGVPIGTLVATSGVIAFYPWSGTAKYAQRRILGHRTLARPALCPRRLDPAQRRNGGTRRRDQLAVDARPLYRGETGLLPNSFLAKLGLTEISRPDEMHLQP